MKQPITAITDKAMQTLKSMLYLAMRVSYRRGATVADLSGFLQEWVPSASPYREGMVESLLQDLHRDGKVALAGARWYPVGIAR